jgi:precorrin-6A/cobalt-precorrin-6A reductase
MNVLILGGTTEASALARALAGDPIIRVTLSLAGRTRAPLLPAVASRRGGFGGVDGLARYLRDERVDALVDATHPFAAQMSRHALAAAGQAGVPCLAIVRPAWQPQHGDAWIAVPDMQAAVRALGAPPRRVFLTVGQQELAPFAAAPWHDYLIRSVEPPDPASLPPRARCIAARGPFEADAERRLLEAEAIETLVTKNSGGSATIAKLDAARALRLPVVMVARPPGPDGPAVPDAEQAAAWLRHQASARRGV